MISTIASIYNILTAPKQYIIPEYQRNYSWDKTQWERLWNDLIDFIPQTKITPVKDYFFGSIVRCPKNSFVPVSECWLIDGQQRTTTIIIFLTALRDCSAAPISGLDLCIKNTSNPRLEKKLLPKKNDKQELDALINGTAVSSNGRIKQAYDYFVAQIGTLPKTITPKDIFQAFGYLKMVDIEIQNEDPQVIFETLNSTGRNLSVSDKIRNFVMMGLSQTDREKLLIDFWDKLDTLFSGISNYESEIDEFLRKYLIFKLKRNIKGDELYEKFRQHIYSQKAIGKTIFNICDDILKNAEYYVQFLDPRKCNTAEKEYFQDLRDLNLSTHYPLLLLLKEYKTTTPDTCEILKLTVSFFVRRMFCNINSQGTNSLFITLLTKINKGTEVNDFKLYFEQEATIQQRFPTNNEFENNWSKCELYAGNALYVLRKLESMNSSYSVSANGNNLITIEHIRPQTPKPPAWPISPTDDAETHHIGNLTLTANNSELGNKSFLDKKTLPKKITTKGAMMVGYHASPYTYLMKDVLSESKWTKTEMDRRAKLLWEGYVDPKSGKKIGVLPTDIWPNI